MLDIKFIREHKEIVERAIKNKKVKEEIDLDKLISLYDERKEIRQRIDEINVQKKEAASTQNIEQGRILKEKSSELDAMFLEKEKEFMRLMLLIPNIPSPDTPIGKDDTENKVLRQIGEKPQFSFAPKPHWELGESLGVIDKEKAAEMSGARFAFLKGDLALLQFALIQFAMEVLTDSERIEVIAKEAGIETSFKAFLPIIPPTMVKPAVLNRMGRLDPKEDKYYIESDDVYLTGSSEHSMGALHMDEIIPREELPKRYIGYSTCFRREAGTYGKDTKGILRMHQFDKLEMETFCLPENSQQEQNLLVAIQEHVMQKLKLPYEVMLVCTGDMGTPDYRQIDINTWMPGQDTYRETHSSDLNTSFQSRRLNTRYKREDGTSEHVHMNDATLFAIGRMMIAIMENYQQEDGTIRIPEVLQKYMGNKQVIE